MDSQTQTLVPSDASKTGAPAALYDLEPVAMVERATAIANALKNVIDKQKLYNNIQGKNFVKVEGWTTLGMMLGILPREVSAVEATDGSYEAVVELYNIKSGAVVGRGSALCGVDEKRWGSADRYARRSMAVTRATSKAYRLALSWIMAMAGYEVTPSEEIPTPVFDDHSRQSLKELLEFTQVPQKFWADIGNKCKEIDPRDWLRTIRDHLAAAQG